ncbi:hypothetical protein DAPPUDRAFT_45560 [Daphnia pulex]|uniref:BTB domain-containing protein n=1 Tax=Daphnia pulex TaxID=6669 RepID=E9G3S5_DAPPU|nr:hypothetical protein DAPPUDRAFT_45560 [Daphnia pulex]|eukprot:EFX85820.1 hypothetical protein DAPPUDRAFT_45560 [Daphnia pulex]
MFYNQHLCDVHFDFKDSQTVGAHTVILSAGSPVFSAMFRSEFLESKTKKVNIIDIDIEVFRQLLIYLYTGSAPKLAEENMTQLLFEAADKYNIDNLKTECTDVLLKCVNLDNAISLLIWSHFHSAAKLKEASLKFLAENSLEICSQPEWMDLIINYPEFPVFSAMFRSEFLESITKKVNIIDIDIEVFRQLLIYLYTGSAPKLAEENMTQLLFVAADKYNIDNLKTECTDVLLKCVNLDNAISLLIWSHFHSAAKLKEASLKFLAENSLEICSQPEWMDLIINYPELCLLTMQHMSKLLNKTNKTAND